MQLGSSFARAATGIAWVFLLAACDARTTNDASRASGNATAAPAPNPASLNSAKASDFMSSVTDLWLTQIAQVPTTEPDSVDDVWQREQTFEVMASNLDSDRLQDANGDAIVDPPAMAKARARLRAALSAKQARVFPVLRAAFVKLSAAQMWENNVEVRGSGKGITYRAGIFADNASIKAAEDASAYNLKKLRFNSVTYEWCTGCSGWTYKLSPPSDSSVGTWPGTGPDADFEVVK